MIGFGSNKKYGGNKLVFWILIQCYFLRDQFTGAVINRSAQSSTDIFSKLKVRGWLFNRSNSNANTKTMIKARAQSN